MKTLQKIVIVLLLLAGFLGGGVWYITDHYGKELKRAALDSLNGVLKRDVEVERMDVSALTGFPYISVHLEKVYIPPVKAAPGNFDKDTLLYAERMALRVDLFDAFSEEKEISGVKIRNGHLDLYFAEGGKGNYRIWRKEAFNSGDSSEASLELKRLALEDMKLRLWDHPGDIFLSADLEAFDVKGVIGKEGADLQCNSDFFLEALGRYRDPGKFVTHREASLDAPLTVSHNGDHIRFSDGLLRMHGLKTRFDGVIKRPGADWKADLRFSGEDWSVNKVLSFAPKEFRQSMSSYETRGDLSVDGSIQGPFGPNGPDLSASLDLRDGVFALRESRFSLRDIGATAHYTFGHDVTPHRIRVDSMEARSAAGVIQGKGTVSDFGDPRLETVLEGRLSVPALLDLFQVSSIAGSAGTLRVNAKLSGRVGDLEELATTRRKEWKATGRVTLADGRMKRAENMVPLEDLEGTFILDGNDARIEGLNGKAGSSDFRMDGQLKGFLPYVATDDQPLQVIADWRSDTIDLGEWLKQNKKGEEKDEEENYHFAFPDRIDFDLKGRIGVLRMRKFRAQNINGRVELTPHQLVAENIGLATADGEVKGRLKVAKGQTHSHPMVLEASVNGVRIREVFRQFENFHQDFIRSEHLKGSATAEVRFRSAIGRDLHVETDRIVSVCDVTIDDGELIDFGPLQDITAHLRDRELLGMLMDVDAFGEALERVRFERLHDRIRIEDQKVIVSGMDIRSNAMDIHLSGNHTFDNVVDYHFNFKLSELLSKEKKSEFGYIKDDGTGKTIFLSMEGQANDPTVSFDRKASRQHLKARFEEEKEEVRSVLEKEFKGVSDSTSRSSSKAEKASDPEFEIEWGGDEKKEKEEGDEP